MAVFGRLRLAKGKTVVLLLALVLGLMHVSLANETVGVEHPTAEDTAAPPTADHNVHIQYCVS